MNDPLSFLDARFFMVPFNQGSDLDLSCGAGTALVSNTSRAGMS